MARVQPKTAAPDPEPEKNADTGVTNRRGHWQEEIAKAERRYGVFHRAGSLVQDRYRLEKENSETDVYLDRYNILYSSTETAKPSLYAQTPKVQATKRHKDRENQYVTLATMLLEQIGQYALEETDFDGVMKNVVQDYLLPGMGQAWVRYEPRIGKRKNANDNSEYDAVDFEGLDIDYVHYRDFVTGVARVWKEVPWVGRRVYFDKKKATKRFGPEKANALTYSYRPSDDGNGNRDFAGGGGQQAIIWEVWDKVARQVLWFSEDYAPDVLDILDDPLKLTDFFPCPEPVRAVWTTRTMIPKSFYSQYKAQAEELDNLTARIRHLTKALRAIGVYDASQEALKHILTGDGNKMVPVDNWALFAQQGGIQGSIQWIPIKDIATVLTELLRQREIVKGEIYEISGFSDIQRGLSKASETLGAQEIKNQWASGRLRDMQKEIQRFCRDLIRIQSEIMAEHFSTESIALYAGFDPPEVTPEEQAAAAQYVAAMQQYQQQLTLPQQPGTPPMQPPQKPGPTARQQAVEVFQRTVQLIKDERRRCALIGIETDSTIQPDEQAERKDRMEFLASAGAFLQQAGPMALQYPDMRGLLGAIMMFVIRTFRASRPLEKEFEDFTKKLAQQPATPPPGQGGEGGGDPHAAQAQVQGEQIKSQALQAIKQMELQAQGQQQQADLQAQDAIKRYEIDTKARLEQQKLQQEHEYRMAEISVRQREVAVKEAELGIKQQEVQTDTQLAVQQQQHEQSMDVQGADREERQFEAGQANTERQTDIAEAAAAQKSQNEA